MVKFFASCPLTPDPLVGIRIAGPKCFNLTLQCISLGHPRSHGADYGLCWSMWSEGARTSERKKARISLAQGSHDGIRGTSPQQLAREHATLNSGLTRRTPYWPASSVRSHLEAGHMSAPYDASRIFRNPLELRAAAYVT